MNEELEREWEALQQDRESVREVFPTGDAKVNILLILRPSN